MIAQSSIGADGPDLRERVAALFRPLVAERIALSRDGKHVAYTEYDKGCLCVVILNLEEPHARVRIEVEDARDVSFSREKQPVRMRFLDWAGNGRLVFSQEEERVPRRILMSVAGVDANGENARKLLDAKDLIGMLPIRPGAMGPPSDFYRSSVLLGFPPGERDVLHVLARGVPGSARTPPSASTVFGVDVATGRSTSLGDDFAFGDPVYDQQGRHRITFRSSDLDGNRIFDLIDSGGLRLDEATFGALLAECRFSQANQLRKRSYPVGFDFDPNILWIASNAVGDRFGIYGLDLKARRPTGLALEHPVVDFGGSYPMYPNANLIRDRATGRLAGVSAEVGRPFSVWCDGEIAEAQRALEAKFPRRTVRILQWSDARNEFLVQVTGGPDPGRSFVWKKATNLVVEIGRRAPWLSAADLCPSESFELMTPYGARLTGFLTRPRGSRFNPPAALVCFAEDLPGRPHSEFDPEAQVFAALGMLVVRINHRGVRGFGLRHLEALSEAADRIPIDDAVAVLDWLGRRGEVNRRRVATLGRGFGGYLAVRALQLRPEAFRCAVAIDATLDPELSFGQEANFDAGPYRDFAKTTAEALLKRGKAPLASLSVLDRPERIKGGVALVMDAAADAQVQAANGRLQGRLGEQVQYLEVTSDFKLGLPEARTRAYRFLEAFFNENLYKYKVELGDTEVVR